MVRVRTLVLVTLIFILALSAPARAETTKEFLAKCAPGTKACRDSVLMVSLLMQMDKAKRNGHCVPKDLDTFVETKAITDWLAAQPNLSGEPATASIEKAYRTVYPTTEACLATYGNPFPPTTKAFLTYCATEPKGQEQTCYGEIAGVGVLMEADYPKEFCPITADPKDAKAFHVEMVQRDTALRAWLNAHPEVGAKPRREGITAAYKALYSPPCAASATPK